MRHHHHSGWHALAAACTAVWLAGWLCLKGFVLAWWYLMKWSVMGPVWLVRWLLEQHQAPQPQPQVTSLPRRRDAA